MSKKHGETGNCCPYCLKRFWSAHALKAHLRVTKHSQFIGDQQADRARKALQHYHQDKVAES